MRRSLDGYDHRFVTALRDDHIPTVQGSWINPLEFFSRALCDYFVSGQDSSELAGFRTALRHGTWIPQKVVVAKDIKRRQQFDDMDIYMEVSGGPLGGAVTLN